MIRLFCSEWSVFLIVLKGGKIWRSMFVTSAIDGTTNSKFTQGLTFGLVQQTVLWDFISLAFVKENCCINLIEIAEAWK